MIGSDEARHQGRTGGPGYGSGSAGVHHGEIAQGVFDHGGHPRPGLVSLMCDLYHSQARFWATPNGVITVEPATKTKALRAAEATLALLAGVPRGGLLRIRSNVPPARGFGSSTSDVLAAVRAVLSAHGRALPAATIACLVVEAEIASDPLMFDDESVLLFAHRDGDIIEDFGAPLPPMDVLGFGTSSDGRGVDTLALPHAVYTRSEHQAFDEIRTMLRLSISTSDPHLLGRTATISTRINQRRLPIPGLDTIEPLVRRVGAVGLQTAHSGDIAGLLFDGRDPETPARRRLAQSLLSDIGISATWHFTVGKREKAHVATRGRHLSTQ
ncbi:GHMP kinase [Nonomuraea insulae]|uniref:GHMP kinase n=1 Tax=Nonomuraea insulae TaxID=1616787 RepID=A0ABW1D6U6_9ACTN